MEEFDKHASRQERRLIPFAVSRSLRSEARLFVRFDNWPRPSWRL